MIGIFSDWILKDPTLIYYALGTWLILLITPLLHINQRVHVFNDHFVYKGLFSEKVVIFKDVKSIGLKVSVSTSSNRKKETFHSLVFLSNSGSEVRIPFIFLAKGTRGRELLSDIKKINADVVLDEYASKIKNGQKMLSLEISQIATFVTLNLFLLIIYLMIS